MGEFSPPPDMHLRVSVLMPAYNEEATVERAVEAVLRVPLDKEVS